MSDTALYHNGERREVNFNLENLKVGQSVGCCVTRNGEMRYFIDGVDRGIVWTGLPTNRLMWGVADIYGLARKIMSEFFFGEYSITLRQLQLDINPQCMRVQGFSTQLCVRMCVCVSLKMDTLFSFKNSK